MNFVKKYLIPNKDNDYKPHLLRKAGIASVAVVALALFAIGVFQNFLFERTNFLSAVLPPVLVDLANQDRIGNQVATLTVNPLLEQAAQAKANDMASKGYFSHNSPDGKTPWYWFSQAGYKYASAGENLAINFTDSGEVNTAWMNSPGHRANILNGKFTEIGIATAEGVYQGQSTVFVVQAFGRPAPKIVISPQTKPVPTIKSPKTNSVATTSTSTTPKSSTPSLIVLGESVSQSSEQKSVQMGTQMYTETEGESANVEEVEVGKAAVLDNASPVKHFATNSKQVVTWAYQILAAIVVLVLALTIGIEIKRQHPRNVIAGVILLAFILTLLYIYQNVIFGQVVVI